MTRAYTTTTTLAANGTLTTPWFSIANFSIAAPLPMAAGPGTEQSFVAFSVYSDQIGTITIQETDDATNPNLTRTVASYPVVNATPLFVPTVTIRRMAWRVVYQNGPLKQNSFELAVNVSSQQPRNYDSNGNLLVNIVGTEQFFLADPVTFNATSTLTDILRALYTMIREQRVNNLLTARLAEPYSAAPVSPTLVDPDRESSAGVDTN